MVCCCVYWGMKLLVELMCLVKGCLVGGLVNVLVLVFLLVKIVCVCCVGMVML